MEIYVKIAACSVVCALLCAVLKPHEGALALAVSVLAAAGAAVAALGLLSPVLEFFEKLLSFTGLSSAVFSPLLKTVAIALLGQIAGAFCQDAGQGALGKMVELCGTVLCLCTALPLATMLLELLQELGGGGCRKLVLALSALLLLITPALAREPEEAAMPDFGAQALEQALDGQTREALGDVSAASVGDFATQLWNIVTDALSNANLALRSALFSAGKVLAAGILCAFASGAQEDPGAKQPAQIAGAFAITALCTRDAQSMIALARETITKISDFTALLLPVLSSSLAASGGSVSAGTLLAGGSFAMSLLTKLASGVLIPLVYLYILLATAESATDGGGLGKIRELCGWAVRLSVKGLCAVFTAYLSLSRVLTGSADAMAVKAAQAAFSGMVPVVGSILSDASESLLASAGLIRSAAGAFGMLAVLAMALAPFARLGAFYLALRLAGAIGADAVSKAHAGLISNLASAMGYMLAIAASTLWMSLVSSACFLKAVGG